jgi:hypothetical protein
MSSVEMSTYNYSKTAINTPYNIKPTGYEARPNTPANSHHGNEQTLVNSVMHRKKGKSSQCKHRRRHRHSAHVPGLLTSTPTKDDVVTTTIYNIDDMSSITFQNTRCVSEMGYNKDARYGPMHSTIKLGHKPSTSSPIRERRKRCSKHRSTGGPVLRLDFTDLNNTGDSDINSPGLKVLQSSRLRQVINDKIMSVFNFNDLDDSMDTQIGSLRGSSSSESLGEQQKPTINQLGNDRVNPTTPVTSYNIVASQPAVSSDVVSASDNNQVTSGDSSDSAYTSDYYPEENRRRSSHNTSMESDMTDFMAKPMHKVAVVAKKCTDGKPKKKTLMSKLKSFGKHFYGRKCDQIQTLAVL